MAFDTRDIQQLQNYIRRDLSERFCRKIDVTAALTNGEVWVLAAHFAPGYYYKEFFKPEDYANTYEWSLKFIERAIKYEKRRICDMNYCHEYETAVTERQKEYLNILYSMFDSFANEKKYAFDSETDVERGFVKFIFRNRRGKCYRHLVNINDTRHTNLYPLVHDITVEVDRLLSEDSRKSITEIAGAVIKGEWGNGPDRVKRLTEAGYDSHEVQKKANELTCTMNLAAQIFQKSDIKDVIFNNPATIVLWKDGTKTVVKATEEEYDPEKGLAMAIAKKRYGNKWSYYNVFKHWLKKYKKSEGDYEQVTYTTKLIMEED